MLIGRSRSDIEALILAYLQWCQLLDLTVTKVQVWWNGSGVVEVQAGAEVLRTVPLFKVVGVYLGVNERAATKEQLAHRLPKAMATVQRLRALNIPASLASLLWKSTVLPQAVYGCEV